MEMYEYVKSTADVDKLRVEIIEDVGITTELLYITYNKPDDLGVSFSGSLSPAEEIALNTVISGHDGIPINDPYGYILTADGGGGGTFWPFTSISGDYSPVLATQEYIDIEIANVSGSILTNHADLTGLEDDDHSLYVPRTGVRGFTSTVSGITPVNDEDLVTKNYVDQGDVDNFLELTDTPTTYSGYEGMVLTVVSGGGVEFTDISDTITAAKVESFYATSSGLSATTSLNFQRKVRLAISSSEPGFYEIIHSCLQSSDDSGIPYRTRLLIDDTIGVQQTFEELYNFSHTTDAWRLRSGTFVMELDGNAHTIDLEYATGKKNRVVYMREAFISAKRLVIIE